MARRGKFSANKRERETNKQERRQKKAAKRVQRQLAAEGGASSDGIPSDPDLEGIVSGPQPPVPEAPE